VPQKIIYFKKFDLLINYFLLNQSLFLLWRNDFKEE